VQSKRDAIHVYAFTRVLRTNVFFLCSKPQTAQLITLSKVLNAA